MFKYCCLNNIAQKGLDEFGKNYTRTDDVSDVDGILVRSTKMHDFYFSDKVKCVVRVGVGVNNVPIDKCNEKGIVLFNTPGANANAVKEMVVSGMLLASRDIIGGARFVDENRGVDNISKFVEKEKRQFAGTEVSGKTLGVIGLGEIGVLVANTAVALGMRVWGYDPYLSVRHAWSLDRFVKRVEDVNEIYEGCDYITIHIPLVETTKHTINSEAISKMKDGVILLNFARDILYDEEAVLEALKTGKVHKYVTDFANPLVAGNKDCIITPHIGASTKEAENNSSSMAVSEMKDFLENGNINHSVNYSNCDMGKCKTAQRLTICHKNITNMIANFTNCLGDKNINIDKMLNSSKGDYAYTMFDIDKAASTDVLNQLKSIDGVIKVRTI